MSPRQAISRLPGRVPGRRLHRTLALLLGVAVTLVLAACGQSHTPLTREDNTGAGGVNSDYITLGPLKYQVQISRPLNPFSNEDEGYLAGLPPSDRLPTPGTAWLGVFLLVLNPSSRPAVPASSFALTDTQGHLYRPVPLLPTDPYAYSAQPVPAGGQLPLPGTTAFYGPTGGELLLFHIPYTAYDNRPLTLIFSNPLDATKKGIVTLDV